MKKGFWISLLPIVLAFFVVPAFAAVPDLSGRWNLNDNTDSIARDTSANGLNGQVSGTTLVGGKYGNAYNFASSGDLVRVGNNTALEPANVTVEAWVNAPASPGIRRYIVSKGAQADFAASYGLYTGDNGGLVFYISNGVAFMSSPDAGLGIWDGNWHHAAGTFDGSTVRLYIDGKEVGSGTPAPQFAIKYNLSDGNDLLIGGYAVNSDTHNFTGTIDEVRVWSKALNAQEVSQHAQTNSSALINSNSYSLPGN